MGKSVFCLAKFMKRLKSFIFDQLQKTNMEVVSLLMMIIAIALLFSPFPYRNIIGGFFVSIGWSMCNPPRVRFYAFCLLFGLFGLLSNIPIVSIISIPIFCMDSGNVNQLTN
jgi:hypothetical protein